MQYGLEAVAPEKVINTTDTIKYECDSIEDGIVIVNSLHNIRYEGMD